MNTKLKAVAATAAALALIAAGCGDDESSTTEADATTPTEVSSTSLSTTEAPTIPDASESDLDAIEATVDAWLVAGGCDLMTDAFLEEQTGESDPAAACESFESSFTPAEGLTAGDIQYENADAAVEVDGSGEGAGTYNLVKEGDTWKIDSVD